MQLICVFVGQLALEFIGQLSESSLGGPNKKKISVSGNGSAIFR